MIVLFLALAFAVVPLQTLVPAASATAMAPALQNDDYRDFETWVEDVLEEWDSSAWVDTAVLVRFKSYIDPLAQINGSP